MKAYLREWIGYGQLKNLPSWFVQDQEIEVSMEMLQELYDTGNNVMLYHSTDVNKQKVNLIFVDDKCFTQW